MDVSCPAAKMSRTAIIALFDKASAAMAVGALSLALTGLPQPSAAALKPDRAWTQADRQAAFDMALAHIEATKDGPVDPIRRDAEIYAKLKDLATAMADAGEKAQAREIALRAARLLAPPAKLIHPADPNTSERGKVNRLLARLGAVDEAQALANIDAPEIVRHFLLSEIALGQIAAGDTAQAGIEIARVLARRSPASDVGAAAYNIALALIEAGTPGEALPIAADLPDDYAKARVLGRVARALCEAGGGMSAAGMQAAARAAELAQRPPAFPNASLWDRTQAAMETGKALIACGSPADGAEFVARTAPPQIDGYVRRGQLADALIRDGKPGLARAVAPQTHPRQAEAFAVAAERALKYGDKAEARRLALEAYEASVVPPVTASARGKVRNILVAVGAFDEAMEAGRGDNPESGNFRFALFRSIVQARDSEALARHLPTLRAEFKQRASTWGMSAVYHLIANGYRAEGDAFFRAFEVSTDPPAPTARDLIGPVELARRVAVSGTLAKAIADIDAGTPDPTLSIRVGPAEQARYLALTGNVARALATARRAGPMTKRPNPRPEALITRLASLPDGATPPAAEALVDLAKEVEAAYALLPDVPGPQAELFVTLISDLIGVGDTDAAWSVLPELEVEPRAILGERRNFAMLMLASHALRIGNRREALSIVGRMDKTSQWMPLRELIKLPLDPG
jgi:hypothetical protein